MGCRFDTTPSVMAGLVPAIHAAPSLDGFAGVRRLDDVDDRDKPGHDGGDVSLARPASLPLSASGES